MYQALKGCHVHLGSSDFCQRRQRERSYLAAFPRDRLLYTFRIQPGLASAALPLGGWESENCAVRGHFTGHFLSACARFAYADQDAALAQAAREIVAALEDCARPDGYLSAFPDTVLVQSSG